MNSYTFEKNGNTIIIEAKDINFALEMMKGLKADGYTLTKSKINTNG